MKVSWMWNTERNVFGKPKLKQAFHPCVVIGHVPVPMWRTNYTVKTRLQREFLCLNACNWYLTHSLPKKSNYRLPHGTHLTICIYRITSGRDEKRQEHLLPLSYTLALFTQTSHSTAAAKSLLYASFFLYTPPKNAGITPPQCQIVDSMSALWNIKRYDERVV